jgi:hypothetical protein
VECHPNMMMVEMFNNEEYLASLGYVRRQSWYRGGGSRWTIQLLDVVV